MQVNVLVATTKDGNEVDTLVIPFDAAIPRSLQHLGWRNMATTTLLDLALSAPAAWIESELSQKGYALLPAPTIRGRLENDEPV